MLACASKYRCQNCQPIRYIVAIPEQQNGRLIYKEPPSGRQWLYRSPQTFGSNQRTISLVDGLPCLILSAPRPSYHQAWKPSSTFIPRNSRRLQSLLKAPDISAFRGSQGNDLADHT